MATAAPSQQKIDYPEDDGKPMAENTLQFRWIVTIQGGLDALFANRPDIFVAGDLLWYPVEGNNKIRTAPDAMVVIGRPKGDRGSYRQWEEANLAPQVVFEVLSPGNRGGELMRKFQFYEQYGVVEYYTYDPDSGELTGWRRDNDKLGEIQPIDGWVSPLLGVRFERVDGELVLFRPDGRRFATYVELEQERERARREADEARHQANEARLLADEARHQAEQAAARADRLAARLRELGIEPDVE